MGDRNILKKSSASVFQLEDGDSNISEEHLISVFQISMGIRNILKNKSASVFQLEDETAPFRKNTLHLSFKTQRVVETF
jgi:hypothetical protein